MMHDDICNIHQPNAIIEMTAMAVEIAALFFVFVLFADTNHNSRHLVAQCADNHLSDVRPWLHNPSLT